MKTVKIEQVAIMDIKELTDGEDRKPLRDLLPTLDDDAKDRLTLDIKTNGIREPLSLAMISGQPRIIDGHNRFDIASELKFPTVPAVFYDDITDQTAAEIWMVNNQLAKRNMSTMERIKMVLLLEPQLKEEARERQRTGAGQESAEGKETGKVVEILGKMAGKSRDTIVKAKTIIDAGCDRLIAIAGEKEGGISINAAEVIAKQIKGLPAEEQTAIVEEALAKAIAEKPVKAPKIKPESNRNFELEYVTVDDTRLVLTIYPEFYGKSGHIKLASDEAVSIKTMIEASEFYGKLASDLKTAAKLYKTPEIKEAKPSAKDKKAEANRLEIEALINSNNRLTDEQKAEFEKSPLEHKALVKAIKKACDKAQKQYETMHDDFTKLSELLSKNKLTSAQKETIVKADYFPEEKTYKGRMKVKLALLTSAITANKEVTPTPEAPEPKAASTNKKSAKKADTPKAKASAKAKAPAKTTSKNTGKSGALNTAIEGLKKDTKKTAAPKKAGKK